MKKVIGAFIILISAGIILLALSSHTDVQVKQNPDQNYANQFLSDLADMNNKLGISMTIGEEDVTFIEEKPYLSDRGSFMFPVDLLTDTFNCSTQIYENGKIGRAHV